MVCDAQFWYFNTVNGGFGRIGEMQLLETELDGANFPKTMIRLAGERVEFRVVANQAGAPTSEQVIAAIVAKMLSAAPGRAWSEARGARRYRERRLQRRDQLARICNSDRVWDAGAGRGAQVQDDRHDSNFRISDESEAVFEFTIELGGSQRPVRRCSAVDRALEN